MAKQTMVIGLGQFGMSLARELSQHGSEVLAVDVSEAHIAEISPYVAEAVVMDAMDEQGLSKLAPSKRDTCVCAIGDENREASIVVTALLKQFAAPWIIARATDDLHARILALVGAHEVINPERNYGQRLAIRLAWRNVLNVMPLGGDLVLTEIEAPESFWGRSLAQLELPRRFAVNVSAVLRPTDEGIVASIPDPAEPILRGDLLMLVSTEKDARDMTEKV